MTKKIIAIMILSPFLAMATVLFAVFVLPIFVLSWAVYDLPYQEWL